MNLKLSSSASGTRNVLVNMGGGANLVERSVFAPSTPSLAYSQWYTPGNGSPAISTADYYQVNGLYWMRPYDLDTMGSEGATIKAREGFRYLWFVSPDHPSTINFTASNDFYVGYSNDPQTLPSPTTVRKILNEGQLTTLVDQNGTTQTNFSVYQTPYLVYNPDSGGDKFYIYAEGNANGFQHELGLFKTSDFLTVTMFGPAIPTTTFNGWSSFGRPRRLGVNNWEVYAFGKPDGSGPNPTPSTYKYTSTDGQAWTPDFSKTATYPGPFITVAGQDYLLAPERLTDNDYLSLFSVDADKVYSGTTTRISSAFGPSGQGFASGTVYPGPTYLQEVDVYEESGIATIYVTRGFPSGVTNSLMSGPYLGNSPGFYDVTGSITSNVLDVTAIPAGVPPLAVGFRLLISSALIVITSFDTGAGGIGKYNITSVSDRASGTISIAANGGLMQQFMDIYRVTTNATTAASAAPLGVRADCVSGTVTVSWNNSLPHQNYRVYRGTTAGTQATLIGDVTGTSITDTPTPGSQYFYKVVTMNSGEQGSRVVNVYASNNTLMVTRHVNRVINDGGDISKINMTFLASVDSYLTSNDYWKYLTHWVDARFGIKESGGFITKVYCLGTTRLPRGGDYTPTTSNTFPSTTSNTSYSATSFRGTTPSWINNASSAHGYFGNGRSNSIQRKNEITVIAAYQRPSGTGTAGLFGYGESSGLYLQQDSGSSGNINFAMVADVDGAPSTFTTATVPFASATAAHVAAGIFDGTNLTAYLDGVAGTARDASNANNPIMVKNTVLRGRYGTIASTAPVLASGSTSTRSDLYAGTYNLSNEALFTGAGLVVLEKGLPGAVASITAMYA